MLLPFKIVTLPIERRISYKKHNRNRYPTNFSYHDMSQNFSNTLTVYSASAGTGKTYTLAARYIALLIDSNDPHLYRHILAVTFTNKATAEMKRRILGYLYLIAYSADNDSERINFLNTVSGFMQKPLSDSLDFCKDSIKGQTKIGLRKWTSNILHNILWEFEQMRVSTIDSFLQALLIGMARMAGISADFAVEMDQTHAISTAVDQVMQGQFPNNHSYQNGKASDSRESDKAQTSSDKQREQPIEVLTNYINERLDDEKSWDIRTPLIRMTEKLLKEAAMKYDDDIELDNHNIEEDDDYIMLDYDEITGLKNLLNWRNKNCVTQIGVCVAELLPCLINGEISPKNHYGYFISRIQKSLTGNIKTDSVFKGLSNKDADNLSNGVFIAKAMECGITTNRAQEICNALIRMQELSPVCRKIYLLWKICSQYLNDLSVMKFVKGNIKQNLLEANQVLQARTAYVLWKALRPGDADFILERAGIRYRYIMIDEFQDTSELQWEIFNQLIEEMLGGGGSALVVGDIKQSIYRWRNGDYKIMQRLIDRSSKNNSITTGQEKVRPALNEPKLPPLPYRIIKQDLTRNYRSQAVVVNFNLSVFKRLIEPGHVAEKFSDIYREGSDGYQEQNISDFHNKKESRGYVEIRAWGYMTTLSGNKKFNNEEEKSKAEEKHSLLSEAQAKLSAVRQMFSTISELIESGAKPTDILILVRENKQAVMIANEFQSCPLAIEKGIRIQNNDSFRLDSCPDVLVIVCALKYIYNKEKVSAEFLLIHGVDLKDLDDLTNTLPLNELTEEVVRRLLCDGNNDLRIDVGKSYINTFIDEVHAYVQAYGSDLHGLLTYWEDRICKKTIPTMGNDGIRLMTIHTAKGLEGKTVFIPFCDWELVESNYKASTMWVEAPTSSGLFKSEPNSNLHNHNDRILKSPQALIPVTATKSMEETPFAPYYQQETDACYVDNLNLLYVALTRACDNLFVYTYIKAQTKTADATRCLLTPANVGDALLSSVEDGNSLDGKRQIHGGLGLIEGVQNKISKFSGINNEPYPQEALKFGEVLIEKQKKEKSANPLEHVFTQSQYLPYEYHTSDTGIRFRQSQEALEWMLFPMDKVKQNTSRIQSGIVRHNIFASIATKDDAPLAVDEALRRGFIDTDAQAELIKQEVRAAWNNPKMSDWFSGRWQLLREASILRPINEYEKEMQLWKQSMPQERGPMPKRELRPDRVMILGDKAVVLDFKFGNRNDDKYFKQVRSYMRLLQEMGYHDVEGWLWYGQTSELVAVPPTKRESGSNKNPR